MTPREQLDAARATLHKERDEIAGLLAQAEACAERALLAFEAGRHKQAMKELETGCDLEYQALADCEALGRLSEALYPGEVP